MHFSSNYHIFEKRNTFTNYWIVSYANVIAYSLCIKQKALKKTFLCSNVSFSPQHFWTDWQKVFARLQLVNAWNTCNQYRLWEHNMQYSLEKNNNGIQLLKTLYLYCHNVYSHQTLQGSDLWWRATTHNVTWSYGLVRSQTNEKHYITTITVSMVIKLVRWWHTARSSHS